MRHKLGWRTRVVQSTDKKLKRRFCDTFSDVISQVNAQLRLNAILANPSAKLVNNTVIKVNQDINVLFCFVSLHEESFQSRSNATRPSISLFGHNLSLLEQNGGAKQEMDKKMQGRCLLGSSKKK